MALRIGMVLFPRFTALDLVGPLEVFWRLPGAEVELVAARAEPVACEQGLALAATATFATAQQYQVLFVPGGVGVGAAMEDAALLAFLRAQAVEARWVTSVCTGALVLGAAGLLVGKRATTHWLSLELLAPFGAQPVEERVVVDGGLLTGGGVTAGIDLALRVAAEVAGREAAEELQLSLEYDPRPPFDAGSPRRAPASLVERVRATREPIQEARRAIVARAAARLRDG